MNLSYLAKLCLTLLLINSGVVIALQPAEFDKNDTANPHYSLHRDYRKINNQSLDILVELEQLEQVVDIEIFYWYGCRSCLQVEQALVEYLSHYPQLMVKRTPLVAHISWRQQAYLQPMLAQLGLLMPQSDLPSNADLYQACLSDCAVFESFDQAKSWFKNKLKVDQLPDFNENDIWQAEKDYRKRAESYSISQVPTIIIRESFAVDANSAKSVSRLINIVDYLLNEVTNP